MPLSDIVFFALLTHCRRCWPALPVGFLLLLLALPHSGQGQIVDDTTRQRYGPRTTLIIREANLLRNITDGTPVDTSLTTIHNSRYWFYDSTFQQDLGNVGTASRRLLWHLNTNIGKRFGRTAYDKYFREPADVPYYDTRSPFSFFRFVQGAQGERVFEAMYTRSIKKSVNVGLIYELERSNKVLARVGSDDGLTRHSGVTFFARYATKDSTYHVLLHYYIGRHQAAEQGGIRPQTGDRPDSLQGLFSYNLERVWLTGAKDYDNRDRFHLAQTYQLAGRGFTAFHVLDWRRQYVRYVDAALPYEGSSLLYYPRATLDTVRTDDRADYRQVENTVGLLGRTDFLEYRLYGRHRYAHQTFRNLVRNPETGVEDLKHLLPEPRYNQIFVGGNVAFRWKKIFDVEGAGEYMFFDQYWLRGTLRYGPLRAELSSAAYEPTLTQQQLQGNHYQWSNSFDNTLANQVTVTLDQPLGRRDARLQQQLTASASVVNLNRLVYYNERAVPAQLDAPQQLLIGTVRHRMRYGVWSSDVLLTATQGAGRNNPGLRIPALVGNVKIAAEGFLFKKALYSQVGIETYAQSSWTPYDYSPSTQQFYVQNYFRAGSYPIADVFVNADIKAVTVFLKMAYVNQGLLRNGYFATPYYTGNPRSFQLGVRWNFFD